MPKLKHFARGAAPEDILGHTDIAEALGSPEDLTSIADQTGNPALVH